MAKAVWPASGGSRLAGGSARPGRATDAGIVLTTVRAAEETRPADFGERNGKSTSAKHTWPDAVVRCRKKA